MSEPTIRTHNNDLGDWCPWSGAPQKGEGCPAMCRDSYPDDPDDEETP